MLQRHPQMDPSYHEIQLDLPGDSQADPGHDLPPPHNITVEYAEKQMSSNERHLLISSPHSLTDQLVLMR